MTATGSAYARSIIPDSANREVNDFYSTPPAGTRALLRVEKFDGLIWEPACGRGDMSRELIAHGYEVMSSDLIDRGYGETPVDFLASNRIVPNIVTNPPFKIALPFVQKALSSSTGKVAMLCRLAWLDGMARKSFFEASPLARVWVFSRRISMLRGGDEMMKGGGGMIAFAWYVWEHGHTGKPTLGWIDHKDA